MIIGIIAGSTSGVAILLYAMGIMSMTYSVTVLAPLTVVAFAAILVRSRGERGSVLTHRIVGGLLAGAAGLVAYDGLRIVVYSLDIVPFNPFAAIEVYGLLILDQYEHTTATRITGWAFHTWNGLTFAIMYTLAVGRGRLWWAVAWAMLLELAMLASYPSMFQVAMNWEFVTMSLVGHVAYGLAIGVVALRVVRC